MRRNVGMKAMSTRLKSSHCMPRSHRDRDVLYAENRLHMSLRLQTGPHSANLLHQNSSWIMYVKMPLS